MSVKRLFASVAAGVVALTVAPPAANALVVVRITNHGYILADETEGGNLYEGRVPVGNTQNQLAFIGDITAAVDAISGPPADFLSVMQLEYEPQALAFYFGLKNDTLGLGIRSPLGNGRETYDLNAFANTSFPVTGFLFLNSYQIYVNPLYRDFGAEAICTQEFAHRFGSTLRIPPQPGALTPQGDAGVPDGSVADDGGATGGGGTPGPDLAPDALLGRQRAHWSFFMNTNGSPMEGNAWEETSPGVFRTQSYTTQFSPLDLYTMGLIPASEVPPFWIIAEPDAMGMTSDRQPITRETAPHNAVNNRPVTIRGRRVTYTIDDIVRTNGPRVPAYRADGTGAPADMRVAWVLLVNSADQVTDRVAADFDRGIEQCNTGYSQATGNRSHLVPVVAPSPPDAGNPAPEDAAVAEDVPAPTPDTGTVTDAGTGEAGMTPAAGTGGCGCRTAPNPARGAGGALGLALGLAGVLAARRRRTSRQ